ncbi:MAG: hypothetical protein M1840_003030 [Geoglossum simile]|nr:MAG: hypothetical protein M1840_003030 [Geoglossum simile]
MLKKTRYTQRYMKLDVSRFCEPDSHSGANVIKPGESGFTISGPVYFKQLRRGGRTGKEEPSSQVGRPRTWERLDQIRSDEYQVDVTSVQLGRGQHDTQKPNPAAPIPPPKQPANPNRQRARAKHRQDLQTNSRQIRKHPPPIRLAILLPQLGRRRRAVGRAIRTPGLIQEIRRIGQVVGVREEAIVEVRALEDEVDQRVKEVPDEENAEF